MKIEKAQLEASMDVLEEEKEAAETEALGAAALETEAAEK